MLSFTKHVVIMRENDGNKVVADGSVRQVDVVDFMSALDDFMDWAGQDEVELSGIESEGDRWEVRFRKK